jgi:hypothetical protein
VTPVAPLVVALEPPDALPVAPVELGEPRRLVALSSSTMFAHATKPMTARTAVKRSTVRPRNDMSASVST